MAISDEDEAKRLPKSVDNGRLYLFGTQKTGYLFSKTKENGGGTDAAETGT